MVKFPEETLLNIFQYCDPFTLGKCTGVCKQWYRIGNDPILWDSLFKKCLGYIPFNRNRQDFTLRERMIKNITQNQINRKEAWLYTSQNFDGMPGINIFGDNFYSTYFCFAQEAQLIKHNLTSNTSVWETDLKTVYCTYTIDVDKDHICTFTNPGILKIIRKLDGEIILNLVSLAAFYFFDGKLVYQKIKSDRVIILDYLKNQQIHCFKTINKNDVIFMYHNEINDEMCFDLFKFARNTNYIAFGYYTGKIFIYNSETGELLETLQYSEEKFREFYFFENYLIFLQYDEIKVYNLINHMTYQVKLNSFYYNLYENKLIKYCIDNDQSSGKIYDLVNKKELSSFNGPSYLKEVYFFQNRLFFYFKDEFWIMNTEGKVITQLQGRFRFLKDLNIRNDVYGGVGICMLLNMVGNSWGDLHFIDLKNGNVINKFSIYERGVLNYILCKNQYLVLVTNCFKYDNPTLTTLDRTRRKYVILDLASDNSTSIFKKIYNNLIKIFHG